MTEFITNNEMQFRLSCFFGIFILMSILEVVLPRRKPLNSKWIRWANNLGLTFFNSFVVKVVFPASIVGVVSAKFGSSYGLMGLFNIEGGLAIILSIILLDLVIYFQHVLVHAVPTLWRLHQVHHADPDYDVTTGARFHTLEIIFSVLVKIAAVIAIGAPAVAVILFEVILNGMAMFNHANMRLNLNLDKVLRLLFVTPDMHRVHHSTIYNEANSNFGFNLAIWDRIFGTYKSQPELGHTAMNIGLKNITDQKSHTFIWGMIALPFNKKAQGYAINEKNTVKTDLKN